MEHAEYKALRAAFDKNVVIPDTIKGKKVTALGDKIFRWKDSIISITIGKNIKSNNKGDVAAKLEVAACAAKDYGIDSIWENIDIATSNYNGIICLTGEENGIQALNRMETEYFVLNEDIKDIGTACFCCNVKDYNSDGSGGEYLRYWGLLWK